VNGTRGKSTVTRLIAAGLAAGGLRTYAKTTGSAARLILPDLSEVPIRQRGPAKGRASIMEHRWFVREAHKNRAQAFVAECMAIQPETIRALETRLAHSTIGVITNVRLDHMDTMGTELSSVAEALAESVPERGRLLVGSEGMDESIETIFARKAAQRGAGSALSAATVGFSPSAKNFRIQCLRRIWRLRWRCAKNVAFRAKSRCAACKGRRRTPVCRRCSSLRGKGRLSV
jgi:poly-gamma-glutamate synthase PgsB/CapB